MKTETIIWHEITKRPMTDDERRERMIVNDDEAYIYEPLPTEGDDVLVCIDVSNGVSTERVVSCFDSKYFVYRLADIKAWAEMPKGV